MQDTLAGGMLDSWQHADAEMSARTPELSGARGRRPAPTHVGWSAGHVPVGSSTFRRWVYGQAGDLLQGAGFLEEVGGAGDDREVVGAAQLPLGLAVGVGDDVVVATDDATVVNADIVAMLAGSHIRSFGGSPVRETADRRGSSGG